MNNSKIENVKKGNNEKFKIIISEKELKSLHGNNEIKREVGVNYRSLVKNGK